jgi:xylulokinase
MWVEALDLLLAAAPHADLRRIAAVSGSAQRQPVLASGAAAALAALDPARSLALQLVAALAALGRPCGADL